MLGPLSTRLNAFFRATAPDPLVLAVLLTFVSAGAALLFAGVRGDADATPARLLDVWRGGSGMWFFLAFSMQMCLVLVTGHALASSGPVARAIGALSDMPRSTAQGAVLVSLSASLAGLINWGLGLIVGALLAREVARSLSRRRIATDVPLLAASGYMGMLIWHAGLSGSAPLSVTTVEGAAKVLPPDALRTLGEGAIPLSRTILSPMNIAAALGLLVIIPLVLGALARVGVSAGMSEPAGAPGMERANADGGVMEEPPRSSDSSHARTIPEHLERSRVLAWVLAGVLLLASYRFARTTGLNSLGLNEVNTIMLAIGLVCHGSLGSYARAAEDGARGCAGIILQFPLYAGIMAMLDASGLIAWLAELFTRGGETLAPVLTFFSAGLINLFVPSGGGQWGIQGPIALRAAIDAGIEPGKMVMAVAYGDQLTNMLQPFWAVPLLAITGVKARDILAPAFIVMLASGVWLTIVLLVF